jgi:hypothetical protein
MPKAGTTEWCSSWKQLIQINEKRKWLKSQVRPQIGPKRERMIRRKSIGYLQSSRTYRKFDNTFL